VQSAWKRVRTTRLPTRTDFATGSWN
jgi:hypothetical protein